MRKQVDENFWPDLCLNVRYFPVQGWYWTKSGVHELGFQNVARKWELGKLFFLKSPGSQNSPNSESGRSERAPKTAKCLKIYGWINGGLRPLSKPLRICRIQKVPRWNKSNKSVLTCYVSALRLHCFLSSKEISIFAFAHRSLAQILFTLFSFFFYWSWTKYEFIMSVAKCQGKWVKSKEI